MTQIWYAYSYILFGWLLLASPGMAIAYGLRYLVLTRRGLHRPYVRAGAEVLSLTGMAGMLAVVLTPSDFTDGQRHVDWLPFTDLWSGHLWQILCNGLLFIPAGMAFSLFNLRIQWLAALPLMVELVQLWMVPGRVASTEDVLLGTTGALLAYVATQSFLAGSGGSSPRLLPMKTPRPDLEWAHRRPGGPPVGLAGVTGVAPAGHAMNLAPGGPNAKPTGRRHEPR